MKKIGELYKIPDLKLLTSKPMFIIANIDDGYDKEILNAFKNTLSENQKCIVIDTKIEQRTNWWPLSDANLDPLNFRHPRVSS